MFKNYHEIFSKRGQEYHAAMTCFPKARQWEFETGLQLLILNAHKINNVLDVPSGSGYLKRYLEILMPQCQYIAFDPSLTFSEFSTEISLCDKISNLDLKSGSIDACLSMAGLHHEKDRFSFYKEIYRVLRASSCFVIGEVIPESTEAKFLNEFVDKNSSMGHRGDFLDDQVESDFIRDVGFKNIKYQIKDYGWYFDKREDAGLFFQLLFGIDRLKQADILMAIEDILGLKQAMTGYCVNWKLGFFQQTK